jgi:hypothetical protein
MSNANLRVFIFILDSLNNLKTPFIRSKYIKKMEAYPGDPYAYMPAGGGKSRFHNVEGILPLILLLIIAFFVLQFLGILPCIVPIGCGGDIDVVVIGNPTIDVNAVLTSKEARFRDINYGINFPPEIITTDFLTDYKIVILQGDPYFDMNTREAINSYVQGGGKLIVVGDAGSKHPAYSNVAGWAWPRGEGIPVPAKLVGQEIGAVDISYGQPLLLNDQDHPIVLGLKKLGISLSRPDTVFKVMNEGGKVIAYINTNEGAYPAVIEGGVGLGTVMYFAYDPGQTPAMFLATLTYLGG